MKQTNIGIQLYPVVLLLGAFGFWYAGATAQCVACFALSFLMWCVLFGDNLKGE